MFRIAEHRNHILLLVQWLVPMVTHTLTLTRTHELYNDTIVDSHSEVFRSTLSQFVCMLLFGISTSLNVSAYLWEIGNFSVLSSQLNSLLSIEFFTPQKLHSVWLCICRNGLGFFGFKLQTIQLNIKHIIYWLIFDKLHFVFDLNNPLKWLSDQLIWNYGKNAIKFNSHNFTISI